MNLIRFKREVPQNRLRNLAREHSKEILNSLSNGSAQEKVNVIPADRVFVNGYAKSFAKSLYKAFDERKKLPKVAWPNRTIRLENHVN